MSSDLPRKNSYNSLPDPVSNSRQVVFIEVTLATGMPASSPRLKGGSRKLFEAEVGDESVATLLGQPKRLSFQALIAVSSCLNLIALARRQLACALPMKTGSGGRA